jgi:hypothetical protein
MYQKISVIVFTLAACTPPAFAQSPAAGCQDGVVIGQGDTLSAVAERCDVSEASILAANPNVEGSSDLIIGRKISIEAGVPQSSNSLWNNFKGAVDETGHALESIAKGVNSSTQEILDKNPDLRSRVTNLGETFKRAGNQEPASVSTKVLPSTPEVDVEIVATGLAANRAVSINVGAVGAASENVAQVRTSTDGSLKHIAQLPNWLQAKKQVVVTLTDERQTVLARSSRFTPN